MRKRLLIITLWVLFCPLPAVYSQEAQTESWDSVLETFLSDEELSGDALEELSQMYESIHQMPININTATFDELSVLPFLTERQIEDIHAYINIHGPMLTLGELQLTGSLDYATRRLLRHFVYAGPARPEKERISPDEILRYGRSEALVRMDIPLYIRDGFRYHSTDELKRYPNRAYLGSRLSHNVRYSFNWHNRIRFGFTADKDAGEPFMGRNRMGYDYWSAYLYVRDMGVIRELAAGNFKAQLGYGLLMGGGFSQGKSMALSSMQNQKQGLKPHSSTQEYGYLRGAGAAVGSGHTTFTLLAASTPLDATLKSDSVISSLKKDGYHRTELEWSKKHNIQLGTVAANIRYSFRGLKIGTTFMTEKLSLKYKGHDRFTGLSADFTLNRSRYSVMAEISVLNGQAALLASQTLRCGKGWSLNAVFRHYGKDYMSIHSNAMADGDVQNESGLLMGFTHNGSGIRINGSADLFMHPGPRHGASAPSNGADLRMETDWRVGSRDALYATARFKASQKDCRYTGQLEYCLTGRYRIRWTHNSSNGTELRTQLFYARYDFIAEPISNGYALCQSVSRSLLGERLDIELTAALFYTESYDSRISVYESGLRYTYNFMSLYGKGARVALTLKGKLSSGMQINIKAGGIRYLDRDEISSSQQRIASNHKEDISVQFIAKF